MQNQITVDREFQRLIPPLPAAERVGLEREILAHGCRDPLAVWPQADGTSILLDGHNRLEICQKHGVPYTTITLDFKSREEAKFWIWRNQINRRNLSESQRAMIGAQMANMPQGARTDLSPIGGTSQEQAAQLMNVSVRALQRAKVIVAAGSPKLIEASTREIVPLSVGATIAALPKADQERIAQECLAAGDVRPARQAAAARVRQAKKHAIKKGSSGAAALGFAVVLADPWNCSEGCGIGQDANDVDESHLIQKSVKALGRTIARTVQPDAVLFLWSPIASLVQALETVRTWGFTYHSNLVWIDDDIEASDQYVSHGHRLLIVAERGEQPHQPIWRPSSVLNYGTRCPVDKMFPDVPKLAIGICIDREGWHSVSAEGVELSKQITEQTSAPSILSTRTVASVQACSATHEEVDLD